MNWRVALHLFFTLQSPKTHHCTYHSSSPAPSILFPFASTRTVAEVSKARLVVIKAASQRLVIGDLIHCNNEIGEFIGPIKFCNETLVVGIWRKFCMIHVLGVCGCPLEFVPEKCSIRVLSLVLAQ